MQHMGQDGNRVVGSSAARRHELSGRAGEQAGHAARR